MITYLHQKPRLLNSIGGSSGQLVLWMRKKILVYHTPAKRLLVRAPKLPIANKKHALNMGSSLREFSKGGHITQEFLMSPTIEEMIETKRRYLTMIKKVKKKKTSTSIRRIKSNSYWQGRGERKSLHTLKGGSVSKWNGEPVPQQLKSRITIWHSFHLCLCS